MSELENSNLRWHYCRECKEFTMHDLNKYNDFIDSLKCQGCNLIGYFIPISKIEVNN